MPRLQRRSFSNAEEVRRFPNGELRLVTFDDIVFGNFLMQPGGGGRTTSARSPGLRIVSIDTWASW